MSDCILWTGFIAPNGYGRFRIGKRKVLAHRHAWEQHRGPIPDGLYVLHRCDVRNCIRVEHLFLGTHQDNMTDMKNKGRRRGKNKQDFDANPRTGLSHQDVHEIRTAFRLGVSQSSIAELFNISQPCISNLVRGKVWVS